MNTQIPIEDSGLPRPVKRAKKHIYSPLKNEPTEDEKKKLKGEGWLYGKMNEIHYIKKTEYD